MTTTTEPEASTPTERAPKPRSLRRRVLSRISIQSKLLVMLLVTSILSAAVVGAIGYQSGWSSLRASVFDRLTEIRAAQARQLESQFTDMKNSLVIYTRGSTAAEAVEAFTSGFDQLAGATINPNQRRSIVDYYKKQFEKTEEAQTGDQIDVNGLLPTSNAQKYLQAYYTTPFTDWEKAISFDDAHDGSAWSARAADHAELGARGCTSVVPPGGWIPQRHPGAFPRENHCCCRTSAARSRSGGPASDVRWPLRAIRRWSR